MSHKTDSQLPCPHTNCHPDPNCHPDTNCHPHTNCHPDRSIPSPKGMECGVEGPALSASLSRPGRPSTPMNSLVAIFAAVALLAVAFVAAQAQKPAAASITADLPAGPMQAKATTACMECHEARIILQQRLSKAAWTKEVDKMTKWGAVVDPADRDALIDYLSTNFSPDKPAYEAQRTLGDRTADKTGDKTGKSK